MAVWTEYAVEIRGCDYWVDDNGEYMWEDWHEHIEEYQFDTKEDALDFIKSITAEQLREWEKPGYGGIEAVLAALEVVGSDDHSEGNINDFTIVASGEWFGTNLNGIWDGFERIR